MSSTVLDHSAVHRLAVAAAAERSTAPALIRVDDLRLEAASDSPLVRGVSIEVRSGETVGIVGESGSGKTLTCRALLGMLPHGVTRRSGSLQFDGDDITPLREREWRQLRGTRISAVFQDPGSYLNPSIRVGRQLDEVFRVRTGANRRHARAQSIAALARLGLAHPDRVYAQYPFELSGGMLQRVLLAIALAASPDLLIADEATTALDVTVQAEVLDLLAELRHANGLTVLLVSHDLAVVAQVCDYVYVMRDGVVVEEGVTSQVLRDPQHPYTRSLRESHLRFGIERVQGATP